jgi:hypothetical protein
MSVEGKSRLDNIQELQARLKAHPLAQVGLGLITGVADDDTSGMPPIRRRARNSASACYGRCLSPSP